MSNEVLRQKILSFDLEFRTECIESRYHKHVADTGLPDTQRNMIRYILQYEHVVPNLKRESYGQQKPKLCYDMQRRKDARDDLLW